MGVHCDNFDLWNSRHHRWNSRAEGLRCGVSEHVWGSYNSVKSEGR
jgi:alpha-L-fucosidase